MTRVLALAALVAVLSPVAATAEPQAFRSSIRPLTSGLEAQLKSAGAWHRGCPADLSDLRLLTATYLDFDGRVQTGQLVVNRDATKPLATVFRKLYSLRFPIRHMRIDDFYSATHPADRDITASFECRQAVPSPCTGGTANGNWSNHAYGHAIDLNPRENPYVGCGATRDPNGRKYLDRSRIRKGMVTPAVVRAFASVGWGWGGSWFGSTKDYMHFSTTGH